MERKIGDTFEFEGKTLQVKESSSSGCDGCFFEWQCLSYSKKLAGLCEFENRTDKKDVIFVEATEHEQAEPQKLNLCEILKHCPQGETFWSPMLGEVKLHNIDYEEQKIYVILKTGALWYINADGTLTVGGVISSEIMLYPSRTQRSWTDVKYEPKKERFDPKTLKPFDKILVRNDIKLKWNINMFSHISNDETYKYIGLMNTSWVYCIPYNDDTKHLVGTKDEAPDFYRYWED